MILKGEFTSSSPENTISFGENFASILRAGDAVFLIGDLGSGKTVIARGIACGLGYDGPLTSPSFTLIKTYPGKYTIHHCDLYRLHPEDSLYELGLEEMLCEDSITLFEWGENFPIASYRPRWEIRIEFGESANRRMIKWKKVE